MCVESVERRCELGDEKWLVLKFGKESGKEGVGQKKTIRSHRNTACASKLLDHEAS